MNVPAPQNFFLFYEKNSFYRGFIKLVLTKCCEVFNVTLSTMKLYFQVVLLSQTVVRFFLYLVMYRENSGDWFIYLRSMAHQQMTSNVQVK